MKFIITNHPEKRERPKQQKLLDWCSNYTEDDWSDLRKRITEEIDREILNDLRSSLATSLHRSWNGNTLEMIERGRQIDPSLGT